MRTKGKYVIWVVGALVATILGCVHLTGKNKSKDEHEPSAFPKPDSPSKCVSECVPDSLSLRDFERQMRLAKVPGKELEYWIDGEHKTPGCFWRLEHVECQKDGCLYRCNKADLWRLSFQMDSSLKMEKLGNSTLPVTYIFRQNSEEKENMPSQEAVEEFVSKLLSGDLESMAEIEKKSRIDIDKIIDCVETRSETLRGRDAILKVKKFVPPDPDDAYNKVRDMYPSWAQGGISLTKLGVAWKNDAQRVIVENEYLARTIFLSKYKIQNEIASFDAMRNAIDTLLSVVKSRYEQYTEMERKLLHIKGKIKTYRTRFLSYEVVSPRLCEAHCYLFVGIKDEFGVSSFDTKYPEKGKEYRRRGVMLLAELCRAEWLYSCTQDVRDQFLEIMKYMKKKVKKSEYEESKAVMEACEKGCNDPSKIRTADW